MSQNALLKALEDDARSQSVRVVKEAVEAAAEMIAQAEGETRATAEARLSAIDAEFERRKAAAMNSAKARMSAALLGVRCALIDEALNRALQAVKNLPKDEYAVLLNRLYNEAMQDWPAQGPDAKPVVLVAPGDTGFLKGSAFEVRPDARVSLGVIIRSGDGRVEYENTVRSRIGMVKNELMPALDKILFDKGHNG